MGCDKWTAGEAKLLDLTRAHIVNLSDSYILKKDSQTYRSEMIYQIVRHLINHYYNHMYKNFQNYLIIFDHNMFVKIFAYFERVSICLSENQ